MSLPSREGNTFHRYTWLLSTQLFAEQIICNSFPELVALQVEILVQLYFTVTARITPYKHIPFCSGAAPSHLYAGCLGRTPQLHNLTGSSRAVHHQSIWCLHCTDSTTPAVLLQGLTQTQQVPTSQMSGTFNGASATYGRAQAP